MKTKFLVAIALIVVLAFGISYTFSKNAAPVAQASILQVKRNTPTVLPTSEPGLSEKAIQKYAHSKILTKRVKKMDVSVANFRLENGQLMVDVCFQTPNNGDWRVWDAFATAANQHLLLDTIGPLESVDTINGKKRIITFSPAGKNMKVEERADDGKPGHICNTLAFYLPAEEIDLSQVTLIIKSLGALPREGEECSFYMTTVQSQLDARKTGITLDCANSDNGARINILQKPDDITNEKVYEIIASPEFFGIEGPWEFVGGVQ